MKRVACAMVLVLVITAPAVFGQDNGSGRFGMHNMSTNSTDLPGGGRVDVVHYHQVVFADQPGHPLDNTAADCVGMYRFNAGGTIDSASGSCFTKDAEGDGSSFWWRFEKQGTSDCPGVCGTWGYYDGFGKFKGISGSGVWQQTTMFPDGGAGTWEGTYTLK